MSTSCDGDTGATASDNIKNEESQDMLPDGHHDGDIQADTPQDDTPQADTPQDDTPQADTPQDDTPQDDTPQDDAPDFTRISLLGMLVSLLSYIVDIASNIWMAAVLYKTEDFWWSGLTVAFGFAPCFVLLVLSFLLPRQECTFIDTVFKITPGSMVLFYIRNMDKGIQAMREKDSRKRKKLLDDLIFDVENSASLRLIEAFMRTAPQLVLQLYIMLRIPDNPGPKMVAVRWMVVWTSLISISWATITSYKSSRLKETNKKSFPRCGLLSLFMWRLFTVAARVTSIALLACCTGYGVFILLGIHYVIMLIWHIKQQQSSIHTLGLTGIGPCFLKAFVLIFCSWDFAKDGPTRLKYLFYYTLMYMENVGMLLAWHFTTESAPLWLKGLAFVLITAGFPIGIAFQVLYYRKLHPNNSGYDPTHPPIETWIPFSNLKLIAT